jgi:hypothetical protein
VIIMVAGLIIRASCAVDVNCVDTSSGPDDPAWILFPALGMAVAIVGLAVWTSRRKH